MKIFAGFAQLLLTLLGVHFVLEGFDASDYNYMIIGGGLMIVSTITLIALFKDE